MADNQPAQATQPPRPDPALKRLERFVGTWEVNGRTLDSEEDNISGRFAFQWLPGGFFLQQRTELNFAGYEVKGPEVIGYDPATDRFPSTVYSSMSGVPIPYEYDVQGDHVTIRTEPNGRGDLHGHLQQGRQLRVGCLEAGRGRRPWQRRLRHHCDPSQLSWCSDSTPSHGVGVSRPPAQREMSLHGTNF
jgi:hypothetical protein